MSEWVFEADEASFRTAVLERSKSVPVVVDFWAPWCGPCRTLGPLLERLADQHGGEFVLAKVNVDENPGLAASFGVQSIPLVLGLRDGAVVSEFVGALPEPAVQEFLTRVLPSEGERLAREAERSRGAGAVEDAEKTFRRALEADPRCDRAVVGLAGILAERGDEDEALRLLERVTPGTELRNEADRIAAGIRVRGAADIDIDALRARAKDRPGDLDVRFELAQALAAKSLYEEALAEYLEIVRRDRSFRDEAARKAMLDVFELLGSGNEIVERYRSELAKVLFS